MTKFSIAKQQMQITYPIYQFLQSIVRIEDRGRGNQEMRALLNGIEMPPARTVLKHVDSTLLIMRATDTGIDLELNQTLPTGPVLMSVPLTTGLSSQDKGSNSGPNDRGLADRYCSGG